MGGQLFVNSGTTQNGTRTRALFKFELAAIPPGSKITSAFLRLECTRDPAEADNRVASYYQLFRLLVPWGEGTKTNESINGFPVSVGQGQLATTNEATWVHRFAFTTNTWTVPGAAAASDYEVTATAGRTVFGVAESPYDFGPSTQLSSDLQMWLDNPGTNFGWILISDSENLNFTARGFGSREDSLNKPELFVDFVPPPSVTNVNLSSNQLRFSFTAEANQTYAIESRSSLSTGSWATVTNVPAASTEIIVQFAEAISGSTRFYRVIPK